MNQVCPVCGSEYLGWVTKCSSCGVALVAPGEAPNPLDLPEDQQVVYELGAWPIDLQAEAAAAMAESEIPHAFDGTDLVVHLDHEEAVDALLDRIEQAAPPFELVGGSGDGGGELAYELDGWTDEHLGDLEARLQSGGVPYRIEDGALVVDGRDEAAVDFLVAEVRGEEVDADEVQAAVEGDETSAAVGGDDDDGDDDDDDDGGELVSQLFDVASRLERRPDDSAGLVDFADLNGRIDPERPPFGVNEVAWAKVVQGADDLADALTGELDVEDDGEPDLDADGEPIATVVLAARRLKELLRSYV